MDLATLIGMVGAIGIVLAAMLTGGSVLVFVNVPSILIVLGGTFMVVMIKFSLGQFLGAFKVAARAFIFRLQSAEDLIEQIVKLANIARKEGMLALENEEIENEFLNEGIKMLIDGNSHEVIEKVMHKDLQQTLSHHTWGAKVFSATGEVAPAMGMIGTLIGLVQMLATMDDPQSIGPSMAIALLTTLYGAMLANMIALPIADKLGLRKAEEGKIKAMCIDGVLAIQEGQNPRIIESMLKAYLDPTKRNVEKSSSANAEAEAA
ncbi:MAG: chemotaxis protein MotA [Halioglobus sp.]|jgi:chemotaxis protein MotA